MRLYKAELFKLLSRKLFISGMAGTLALLFLYFWFVDVGGEKTTVDGKVYTGYEAVRMERKITEEFRGASGRKSMLEYTAGWTAFFDVLQMGMVLGSILILFGIPEIFSDEGRGKDVIARIGAGFTVATGIFTVIVLFSFLLCGAVYGYGGAKNMIGIVYPPLNIYSPVTMLPTSVFALIILFLNYLAMLSLCALTLYVSACFKNSFHAAVVSAMLWGGPALIALMFGKAGYLIMAGMPIFLIMTNTVFDISYYRFIPVICTFLIIVLCTVGGYRKHRNLAAEGK